MRWSRVGWGVVVVVLLLSGAGAWAGEEGVVGPPSSWGAAIQRLERTVADQQQELRELRARVERQEVSEAVAHEAALQTTEGPVSVGDLLEQLQLRWEAQTPEERRLTTIYDDGFYLKGKDDQLKIGGWVQQDAYVYRAGHPGDNRFRTRRARLDIRGVLENDFGYRLYGEFAGSSASLQEAWLEYKRWPAARVKVGLVYEPFSLESLTSALWTDFIERSVAVSNLHPAEDNGALVYGNALGGIVEYATGIFSGRGRNVTDNKDEKEGAARLTLQPFKRWLPVELLEQLYVGGSWTAGRLEESFAGKTFTTAPGTAFMTFASGTEQDGHRVRKGLDAEWIYGPGSVKAEWLLTDFGGVASSTRAEDIEAEGGYVAWTHLLTGEEKPRNKPVRPRRSFDPGTGGWGAWEVMGRVEGFAVDQVALDSSLATGTDSLQAYTAGVAWWPNVHTKLMANLVHTVFDDDLLVATDRLHSEEVALLRAQFHF